MRRVLLATLLLTGCGHSAATGPTTEHETYVIERTTYWANKLGVNVRGEVTDARETYGCGDAKDCHDTGWYVGGVAYYYRPDVNKMDETTLSDVAAHEVCHAKFPMHDTAHWCCAVKLGANPTYVPPVTPSGQWPVCQ